MTMPKLTLAAAIAMTLAAPAAEARFSCAPRDVVLQRLEQDFRERPVGAGLVAGGQMVELLISRDGTWTLVVTGPNGVSCMVAVGDSWEWQLPQLDGPGA